MVHGNCFGELFLENRFGKIVFGQLFWTTVFFFGKLFGKVFFGDLILGNGFWKIAFGKLLLENDYWKSILRKPFLENCCGKIDLVKLSLENCFGCRNISTKRLTRFGSPKTVLETVLWRFDSGKLLWLPKHCYEKTYSLRLAEDRFGKLFLENCFWGIVCGKLFLENRFSLIDQPALKVCAANPGDVRHCL